VRGEVGADSSVRGPVVLEPGAVVTGSRITGPVVIGAGSVVRDSAIGPYATLGEGCLVESSTVADSILLDHVSVRGVPGLRGSLIGRAARVTGASHTRLVLGDDARVELVVT